MAGPKKGTKAWKGEITTVFYGINPETLEVDRVTMTRDRTISRLSKSGAMHTHHVLQGRDPRTEVNVVYHLTDIVQLPAFLAAGDKPQVKELEAKAAAMKAAKGEPT